MHHVIDDECGDTETAARILDLSPLTLEKWRRISRGPCWARIGRLVKYRRSELARYLNEATRASTSDNGRTAAKE